MATNKSIIPNGYSLAKDSDFVWETSFPLEGAWHYVGKDDKVIIPHTIQGKEVTSYKGMFYDTYVSGVYSENKNITDMSVMFCYSKATRLDLAHLDTSNVANMYAMFHNSNATTLDLSSFDTSNVTDILGIFSCSQVTSLDLSNFDTSKVTNMSWAFSNSEATTLDLSSFDTSKVTEMNYMFLGSNAKTLDLSSFDTSSVNYMKGMFTGSKTKMGYARSKEDADWFNGLVNTPSKLTFVVKPLNAD